MKKNTILAIIICLILRVNILPIFGNPIPWDSEYQASPVASDNNDAIYYKREVINVSFDTSKAHLKALYYFKNNQASPAEITIRIPFGSYNQPSDLLLQSNGINLDYTWKNFTMDIWEGYFSPERFRAIEFNLSFTAEEEIEVRVQYLRPYVVYDNWENSEIIYNFQYLVGSARKWNHSIESAYFEFWIPKKICDGVQWAPYISILGKNTSCVVEYKTHYCATLKYENWTLPTKEGNSNWLPGFDFIHLEWSKSRPFGLSVFTLFILGIFSLLIICFVVLLLVTGRFIRKKNKMR